ncbi:MAG TPA: HAD family hydrolase [Clostridiales bacterium]|nr:HAD family hydrolase [Clostridiales bacterium]
MEILIEPLHKKNGLKAVVFDFDGTISTLRYGWEMIMEPLMLEMIAGNTEIDDALKKKVREYIDQSTGIQTYYQMKWLAEAVKRYGRNPGASEDPWWYKAEYNRRLMEPVNRRIESVKSGQKAASDFLIKGSKELLEALFNKGIEIYVASGTDDPDVKNEAEILGLRRYFKEVSGAPLGRADCSKEAVLRKLVEDNRLHGTELAVIGDGKVEIALGNEVGAVTLGIASNEADRCGINNSKRERLIRAGAHAIVGDFMQLGAILDWMDL